MNPPTRVGNVVIWQGGYHRYLSFLERIAWFFGKRRFDQ